MSCARGSGFYLWLLWVIVPAHQPRPLEDFSAIGHEGTAEIPGKLQRAPHEKLTRVGCMPTKFISDGQLIELKEGWLKTTSAEKLLGHEFSESATRLNFDREKRKANVQPQGEISNKIFKLESTPSKEFSGGNRLTSWDQAWQPIRPNEFDIPTEEEGVRLLEPTTICPICQDSFKFPKRNDQKQVLWQIVYKCPQCESCTHQGCLDRWFQAATTCITCRKTLRDRAGTKKVVVASSPDLFGPSSSQVDPHRGREPDQLDDPWERDTASEQETDSEQENASEQDDASEEDTPWEQENALYNDESGLLDAGRQRQALRFQWERFEHTCLRVLRRLAYRDRRGVPDEAFQAQLSRSLIEIQELIRAARESLKEVRDAEFRLSSTSSPEIESNPSRGVEATSPSRARASEASDPGGSRNNASD